MNRAELIEKLLNDIDDLARLYDHYEYGLPLEVDEVRSDMVDKVILFLKDLDTVSPE